MAVVTPPRSPGAAQAQVRIGLDLDAVLGHLSDTMDKVHQFLSQNPRQSPIFRALTGTAISDGSTYFYLPLLPNTVPSGRLWDVRRITTWPGGSTDPFAAISGVTVALVKYSGSVPNKGTTLCLPFTDLILAPQQVPNDAVFSPGQVIVRPGEVLLLVYKSTANTQQLMAAGSAIEYIESINLTVSV